jgi:DNA phosphorothioation-associated putative methyltransferase
MNKHKGKKVLNHYYWHESLLSQQPNHVQAHVAQAIDLARLEGMQTYNVVKYAEDGQKVSLLDYAHFFDNPFPSLWSSYTVDLIAKTASRRSYDESRNPPILHRKELLLPTDHPKISEYQSLTQAAELLGLFDQPKIIGFKETWSQLIAQKGYQLVDHTLIPLGNDEQDNSPENADDGIDAENIVVQRHRTALTRYNLSAPMQLLERFGFLNQEKTVFDYGCGKGDDVRNLKANAITANGWDPHFAPLEEKIESDIVNLGFVINVIENINERRQALSNAYQLANELLVVSAMIYNQNSFKGRQFEDGVLTSRHTFQKYFTQAELKEFIDHTLSVDAIAVGVGIFFVFKDADAEQKFQSGRQRSRSKLIRLVERQKTIKPPSKREERYQERLAAIQNLRLVWLTLGRQPFKDEVQDLELLEQTFGSFAKAIRFTMEETDKDVLMQAQNNRLDDLLVYFALYSFSRKKPYRHLEQGLQRDIKVFFGDYEQAITQGKKLLFALADTAAIEKSCKQASEKGVGFYDNEKALHVISDNVELLPPMLRVYVGCGAMLYGDISRADMIKVHVHSGKLSILRYDDFAARLPKLMERVKIKLRVQDFDYFEYGEEYEPTYLYFKSKYLNEEHPDYAEQLAFDEQLESLSLFDFSGYGPKPSVFHQVLASARWQVKDNQLMRSQSIPSLDEACGLSFTYRDLVECGETWQKIKIDNSPLQADSYTALYELAKHVLDPVIDYYGMIKLSYGFASPALTKHIKGRIAPKLDQHVAHEKNKKGDYICERLGAAVDFFVEDESMLDVVMWIKANVVFDRIYYYGNDRPIHISYNYHHDNKGEVIEMCRGDSGRLIPRKFNLKCR